MFADETYKGADDPLIKFLATPCSYERILTAYDPLDLLTVPSEDENSCNVELNELKWLL